MVVVEELAPEFQIQLAPELIDSVPGYAGTGAADTAGCQSLSCSQKTPPFFPNTNKIFYPWAAGTVKGFRELSGIKGARNSYSGPVRKRILVQPFLTKELRGQHVGQLYQQWDRPPSCCTSGVQAPQAAPGHQRREMRMTGAFSPHSTSMVPLWRATMCRTTDRPSPAPGRAGG